MLLRKKSSKSIFNSIRNFILLKKRSIRTLSKKIKSFSLLWSRSVNKKKQIFKGKSKSNCLDSLCSFKKSGTAENPLLATISSLICSLFMMPSSALFLTITFSSKKYLLDKNHPILREKWFLNKKKTKKNSTIQSTYPPIWITNWDFSRIIHLCKLCTKNLLVWRILKKTTYFWPKVLKDMNSKTKFCMRLVLTLIWQAGFFINLSPFLKPQILI